MLKSFWMGFALWLLATATVASAQDECATAPLVPIDNYSTCGDMALQNNNLTGATPSTTAPAPTCGNFSSATNDVWVRFVVPAGSTTMAFHAFNSSNIPPLNPATRPCMAIYRGPDCNTLSLLDCFEAPPIQVVFGFQVASTEIYWENLSGLVPGETLYVRLWDYSNITNQFYFAASVNLDLPEDDCATAPPLGSGGCNILAQGGDMTPPETCGWNSSDNTIFYPFTVPVGAPQPFTITAANAECYNNFGGPLGSNAEIQIAIYNFNSGNCNNIGGSNVTSPTNAAYIGCAQGTGNVVFSGNLPAGNYMMAIDGLDGSLCTYGFSTPLPPVVDFNPTVVCQGVPTTFNGLGTNTPTGWAWIFPGGTPATANVQNPTVTFNTPGTVNVTLTATNAQGSGNVTKAVTVVAQPNATAGADQSICQNFTTLTGSAPGAAQAAWTQINGPNAAQLAAPLAASTGITGLAVGTYVFRYTLTVGSQCSDFDDVTVTVTSLPVANAGANISLCAPTSTTNLAATPAASGTGTWTPVNGPNTPTIASPNSPTSALNGLIAGTYTLRWTVVDGPCQNSDLVQVTVATTPTPTITGDLNYCNTETNSNLTFTPSGGTLSGPGVTGLNFNPSAVGNGTYALTYTYTDACGSQSATANVNVVAGTPPAVPLASFYCVTAANVTLASNVNSLQLTVTGTGITQTGLPPIFVNYIFSPATAGVGTHFITVTNPSAIGSACNSTVYQVTVASTTPSSITAVGPFCTTDPAVALAATPAGGTFSGPGVTAGNFNPATAGAGTHTITYSGNGACGAYSSTTSIVVNAAPTASIDPVAALCNTAPAVALSGTPAGGTFSGTGVSGGFFNPSGLAAGNYTVTYEVTTSCGTASNTTSITVTPGTATPTIDPVASLCATAAAVTLNGSPAGGTFSGTGVTGNSFNPATAGVGTHTVTYTITDACGTASASTDITVTPGTPVPTIDPVAALCNTAAAVTLTGSPAGGTFSGTGVTGNSFNPAGLATGNYTVTYTVTDACGTASNTTVVAVSAPPVVSAGPNQTFCGNFTNLVGSNIAGYTGTWSVINQPGGSPAPIFTPNPPNVPNVQVSNLEPGTYTFEWEISNSVCIVSSEVDLNVTAGPSADAGPDVSVCASPISLVIEADLAANPTPGTTGTWSVLAPASQVGVVTFSNPNSPTATASDLVAGTVYTLQWAVNDGAGCTAADQMTVTVNIPPVANSGPDQVRCTPSTDLAATPAPAGAVGNWQQITGPSVLQFQPGNDAPDANVGPLSIGTYTLEWIVTDGNGCADTADMTLTVQGFITTNAGPDATFCGDRHTLGATPAPAGFTGTWSVGSQPAGSGTVTFSNATSPNAQALGLAPGVYTLVWTLDNGTGCTGNDEVQLTITPPPPADAGTDRDICGVDAAALVAGTPPAGFSGTWSVFQKPLGNPNVNFTPTPNVPNAVARNLDSAGVYLLVWTITSGPGCTSTDTMALNVGVAPFVEAGNDQTVCANQVNLNGNVPNAATGQQGFWSVIGTTPSGLPHPTFVPSVNAPNATAVFPDTNLQGQRKYVVQWNITSPGCTPVTDFLTLTVTTPPAAPTGLAAYNCLTGQAGLTANALPGATDFRWHTAEFGGTQVGTGVSITTAALPSDTFWVSLGSGNCISSRSPVVAPGGTLPPPTAIASPLCIGGQSVLQATFPDSAAGFTFVWHRHPTQDMAIGTQPTFVTGPLNADTAFYLVASGNGCESPRVAIPVTVTQPPIAAFTFEPNPAAAGDPVQFTNQTTGNTTGTSYVWRFGDGDTSTEPNPAHTYREGGEYTIWLVATNAPCVDSATATVEVKGYFLYLPSAFAPGDGNVNALYAPAVRGIQDLHWQVYDRWGILIFEGGRNDKWDGTKNGTPCPEGVYAVRATGRTPAGEAVERVGTVTILH